MTLRALATEELSMFYFVFSTVYRLYPSIDSLIGYFLKLILQISFIEFNRLLWKV